MRLINPSLLCRKFIYFKILLKVYNLFWSTHCACFLEWKRCNMPWPEGLKLRLKVKYWKTAASMEEPHTSLQLQPDYCRLWFCLGNQRENGSRHAVSGRLWHCSSKYDSKYICISPQVRKPINEPTMTIPSKFTCIMTQSLVHIVGKL